MEHGRIRGRRRSLVLKSKRRDDFDTIRDILQVCVNSSTKTHIVSAANLNNKRIGKYLEFLVFMKLLVKKSEGKKAVYHTTPYGEDFLKIHLRVPRAQR